MAKLNAELFVHLADNFPYKKLDQKVSVDIDISVRGTSKNFVFTKKAVELATLYEISVPDSKRLGLSEKPTSEEAEHAFKDIVIALNLHSARGVFVLSQQVPAEFKIIHDADIQEPVVERDAAGNVTVKLSETIRVSDHVNITVGTRLEVDEDRVLEIVRRIRILRAAAHQDFLDALDRFEEGTSSINRVTAVQKYAMVMDKLANLGRPKGLEGSDLDAEVARLSGGASSTAEHIRLLYNRTKHASRGADDQQFLIGALQNINRTVQEAKLMAAEIIKAKLPA